MESEPFIKDLPDLPIKMAVFYSYAKLPDGILWSPRCFPRVNQRNRWPRGMSPISDGWGFHTWGIQKKTMVLEWKIPHFRKPPYPLVNYQFAMKWPNMTVDLPTKDGDFP